MYAGCPADAKHQSSALFYAVLELYVYHSHSVVETTMSWTLFDFILKLFQDVFEMRYAKMPDEPPPPEQPSSASQDTEAGLGSSDEEQAASDHSLESEDEDLHSDNEDARQKINDLQRQVN